MPQRPLMLIAGAALLGAWLWRAAAARQPAGQALATRDGADAPAGTLPTADGPVTPDLSVLGEPDPAALDAEQPAQALRAGMPADRYSDADVVRPGFADYARGA